MTKKPTSKRARVSRKTSTIKRTAASSTDEKPARLKKDAAAEISLKETPTENVTRETTESVTKQSPADGMTMTALPESSPSPPRAAGAQEPNKTPEGALPEIEEVLELLAFRLADEEYAVDILMIREIIRMMEITQVPRRPAFIKGIVSLRGMIIPVFDLRTRLGLTESPPGRSSRILVVGLDRGLVGVIADSVSDVVKVKLSHIEPPPAVRGGSSSAHLKGVTRLDGRLLILLDLEKTVTLE
ncbi:MAG: purine-binding chemotaxis protein CheW [Nitrospirae bacterium]|nr:purine-binding chemotaxis protein CheW [Nitrospirota bacterium]